MQKIAKCSCNDKNVEPNNYDLPFLICRLFANVKYFHSGVICTALKLIATTVVL